jgi:hypothetical protein
VAAPPLLLLVAASNRRRTAVEHISADFYGLDVLDRSVGKNQSGVKKNIPIEVEQGKTTEVNG